MTTNNQTPTHIIIHDLNTLRWLCPNQSFTTNIIFYTADAVDFLTQNNISFTPAVRTFNGYRSI